EPSNDIVDSDRGIDRLCDLDQPTSSRRRDFKCDSRNQQFGNGIAGDNQIPNIEQPTTKPNWVIGQACVRNNNGYPHPIPVFPQVGRLTISWGGKLAASIHPSSRKAPPANRCSKEWRERLRRDIPEWLAVVPAN